MGNALMDSSKLIDQITNLIDEGIRKAKHTTYDEWQEAVSAIVAGYKVEDKSPKLCPRCGGESQVANSDMNWCPTCQHTWPV